MPLILRKPSAPTPQMAESEWNLAVALKIAPKWQWMTMLNYEYARCYEPLIRDVEQLRKSKRSSMVNSKLLLPFARYLAKHFPEFPQASWAQINEKERAARLGLFGVTPETEFYFTDSAWQAGPFPPRVP